MAWPRSGHAILKGEIDSAAVDRARPPLVREAGVPHLQIVWVGACNDPSRLGAASRVSRATTAPMGPFRPKLPCLLAFFGRFSAMRPWARLGSRRPACAACRQPRRALHLDQNQTGSSDLTERADT